jgi:conjugal transfer pilus assembly protein TrbC
VTLAGTGQAQGPTSEVSPHLYVFISSSLSSGELVALARDSASLDAPMLLRGLVGSSLQETLLTLKDVVAQGAGLEVDPLLFESYGVEAVPAVVLTCGGRGEGPFALVYGLSPSQALPILRKALPAC